MNKYSAYIATLFCFYVLTGVASETDFEAFSPGSVNYQGSGGTTVTDGGYTVPDPYGSLWTVADEWGQSASQFDEEVVDDGSGSNNVWRISNALTSSGYSNQPNSESSPMVAGETAAFLHNDRGPDHTSPANPPLTRAAAETPYFHGGFRFKSATGATQSGLFLSVNPVPRQSSYRMSYVGLEDTGNGFDILFYETSPGGSFDLTTVATDLSYTDWHRLDILVEFVDGLNADTSGNDIVKVFLNGELIHTGTTWESYFAENPASFPTPIAVDALLFRSSGTAAGEPGSGGFFIDDVAVTNIRAIDPTGIGAGRTDPIPTLSPWALVLLTLSFGLVALGARNRLY